MNYPWTGAPKRAPRLARWRQLTARGLLASGCLTRSPLYRILWIQPPLPSPLPAPAYPWYIYIYIFNWVTSTRAILRAILGPGKTRSPRIYGTFERLHSIIPHEIVPRIGWIHATLVGWEKEKYGVVEGALRFYVVRFRRDSVRLNALTFRSIFTSLDLCLLLGLKTYSSEVLSFELLMLKLLKLYLKIRRNWKYK